MINPWTRTVQAAAAFFSCCGAFVPAEVGAQDKPPRAGTVAPSQSLRAVGQTRVRVDQVRKTGKNLLSLLEVANDLGTAVRLRGRLDELRPEIEAMMPRKGGVLVIAYVDETRVGEGRVRSLRSVKIAGAYGSEAEAREDLDRPSVRAAEGPILPYLGEPNPRVQTSRRYIWFAAPVRLPGLASPEEAAEARAKLNSLLEAARLDRDSEAARLEIEWHAIDEANKRLNAARGRRAEKTKPPDRVRSEGRKQIDVWVAGERREVATARTAAADAKREADRDRAAVAAMAAERCPAGVTYDECEVHTAWKAGYIKRQQSLQARAGLNDARSRQLSAAADAREARIAQGRGARERDLDARVASAEKAREAEEKLKDEQAEFGERLKQFDTDEAANQELSNLIKEIERVLSRL